MGFFDDLVQGISSEVSKVQARSQEMLHAYNITQEIRELERQKNAKLMEIGRLVCEKYQSQVATEKAQENTQENTQENVQENTQGNTNENISEEQLKHLAKEIAIFERDIAQLQSELDSMKVQSDPNTSASKKADARAGFKPTPGYECPSCHSQASLEKPFCPSCGHSLRANSANNRPDSGKDDNDIIDV